LLRAKYRVDDLFSHNPLGCSPFWHSIHKIKHIFKQGDKFEPGARSSLSFWNDTWIGDEPFSVRFPTLFEKSSDTDLKIAQAYSEEGWRIPFRRNLGKDDMQAWHDLCALVEEIDLEDVSDKISWQLEPSSRFSVRSLYLDLCKAPTIKLTKYLWSYPIPLKIKIFTWQLARGRLPTNNHIQNRGGNSDGKCALCGNAERADHIFFQCVLAQFV
jgi:hypothetical protein